MVGESVGNDFSDSVGEDVLDEMIKEGEIDKISVVAVNTGALLGGTEIGALVGGTELGRFVGRAEIGAPVRGGALVGVGDENAHSQIRVQKDVLLESPVEMPCLPPLPVSTSS